MLLLNRDDIRSCLTMSDAIDAVEDAFSLFSRGAAQVPLRTAFPQPDHDGNLLVMPSSVPGSRPAMGVKVLGVWPRNRDLGLPVTTATMIVVDPRTGMVDAILDGTYLTRLRTGAASGLATRLLARPDATVGSLVGTGGQALCQLEAMLAVRPLSQVRVFSPNPDHVRDLMARAEKSVELGGCRLVAAPSARACVEGADVVTTVTTSNEPVLDASWVAPGTHVNGVGSYTPEMHELPQGLLARADLVAVDSVDAVLAEDGALIDAVAAGTVARDSLVEIGSVADGTARARTSPSQVTLFKTVGIAVQDSVCASRVVEAARERGIGHEVEL